MASPGAAVRAGDHRRGRRGTRAHGSSRGAGGRQRAELHVDGRRRRRPPPSPPSDTGSVGQAALRRSRAKSGAHVTPIPNLGDAAFFRRSGGGDFPDAELDIKKGRARRHDHAALVAARCTKAAAGGRSSRQSPRLARAAHVELVPTVRVIYSWSTGSNSWPGPPGWPSTRSASTRARACSTPRAARAASPGTARATSSGCAASATSSAAASRSPSSGASSRASSSLLTSRSSRRSRGRARRRPSPSTSWPSAAAWRCPCSRTSSRPGCWCRSKAATSRSIRPTTSTPSPPG